MNKLHKIIIYLLFIFICLNPIYSNDLDKKRYLMRFPDIHKDMVVFVYGDDIWKVNAKGGIATRLTFNDGTEVYPKISPDGSMIAFTGQYDGNTDVYVMNIYGGNITRVDNSKQKI